MAFVTCGQFKQAQQEQDEKIKAIEQNALTADDELVENTSGRHQLTVTKIKEAIAGDVEVSVKENSGITGKGTKAEPLSLNLGDTLKVGKDGKLNVKTSEMTARLVDASGRVIGYGINQGA